HSRAYFRCRDGALSMRSASVTIDIRGMIPISLRTGRHRGRDFMFGTADRVAASGSSIRDAIVWIGGIALAGLVIWLFHDELLLVFLAVLLAVSLRGAADRVA